MSLINVFGPPVGAGRWVLCNQLRLSVCPSVSPSVPKVLILPTIRFLDPPPLGAGGSYVTSSVCLSVRQSVCPQHQFSYFPPLDFLDFLHQVSLLIKYKNPLLICDIVSPLTLLSTKCDIFWLT